MGSTWTNGFADKEATDVATLKAQVSSAVDLEVQYCSCILVLAERAYQDAAAACSGHGFALNQPAKLVDSSSGHSIASTKTALQPDVGRLPVPMDLGPPPGL